MTTASLGATADGATVKALGAGVRWRKMLDTGEHATLEDLAQAEGVASSYRILRFTLLTPKIVEALFDGRQSAELQLDHLLKGFPVDWNEQQMTLAGLGGPQPSASAAPSSSGDSGAIPPQRVHRARPRLRADRRRAGVGRYIAAPLLEVGWQGR